MTQPSVADLVARLRAAHPDPLVALRAELDALDGVAQAAGPHWGTVMPGRTWTPGQEAEHAVRVAESSARIARLLLSDRELQPVTIAPPVMIDGKRQAPPGTEPSADPQSAEVHARLAALRESLSALSVRETPGRTFPHPFLGDLEAADWLRMAAWHTAGHRRGMERGMGEMVDG